jgi:hypothetical protein
MEKYATCGKYRCKVTLINGLLHLPNNLSALWTDFSRTVYSDTYIHTYDHMHLGACYTTLLNFRNRELYLLAQT